MSPLMSGESHIDRETAYDVLVNVVPIGILFFFVVLFVLLNPWEFDPVALVAHFLIVFPLVLLAILTYVSARVIARDEHYEKQEHAEHEEHTRLEE